MEKYKIHKFQTIRYPKSWEYKSDDHFSRVMSNEIQHNDNNNIY